ncbi:MAG: diacylglycerol kinase [Candidatus Omnitrophota bacterium]|nr:diacylglycerol kinase [Candidatus Omnitrophota bacterium]
MEKKRKIIDSFNFAAEGLIYVLRSQRNMRIHFLFSMFTLLLGIYLGMDGIRLLLLLAATTFVLFAEMFNTAIELTVDLVSDTVNPLARIIKDISAGAVLLSAVNALIVFYVIFSQYLNIPFEDTLMRIKQSSWHITFIALIAVLGLVLAGKVFFDKGTPFRGGMPSGHAALAFSIWAAVAFSTTNDFIIALSFILAFFVARSRVISGIHNRWEVIGGSLLGALVTAIIFQLLN